MVKRLLTLDASYSARLTIAEKPGSIRRLAIFFAHSGDSWFCLAALALIWLFGDLQWKALSVLMIVSVLATAVVVMALKFSIRRRRPEGNWGGIYRKTDPHSFPSGHAARVAMLAVLGMAFGPTWLGIALLIWALLVIFARVAMGVHYLSDVVAGAFLGVLIGIGVWIFFPLT